MRCSIGLVRIIACFMFLTSVCTVALDSPCIVQFQFVVHPDPSFNANVGRRLYVPTQCNAQVHANAQHNEQRSIPAALSAARVLENHSPRASDLA